MNGKSQRKGSGESTVVLVVGKTIHLRVQKLHKAGLDGLGLFLWQPLHQPGRRVLDSFVITFIQPARANQQQLVSPESLLKRELHTRTHSELSKAYCIFNKRQGGLEVFNDVAQKDLTRLKQALVIPLEHVESSTQLSEGNFGQDTLETRKKLELPTFEWPGGAKD